MMWLTAIEARSLTDEQILAKAKEAEAEAKEAMLAARDKKLDMSSALSDARSAYARAEQAYESARDGYEFLAQKHTYAYAEMRGIELMIEAREEDEAA